MNATTKDTTKGLNVEVRAEVHARAKAACALARMTWDEAVTEALDAWASSKGISRTKAPK